MIVWTLLRNSLPLQLVALALLAWAALGANNFYQRQIGASKFAAKVETANENASSLGSNAAASSLDKRVRGKRDPTTRND